MSNSGYSKLHPGDIMLKKILFSTLLASILNACVTSPTGRNQLIFMPDNQIDQMGLQAFDDLKKTKPISGNASFNKVVNCVAHSLTQQIGGQWEVLVFDDASFNAFALPGYKIGVHTGLLQLIDNPSQLASVIGHEIGHVLAKHSNERMSQETAMNAGMGVLQASGGLGATSLGLLGMGAQYGVLLPFSRTHESEADLIGLDLMAKAGFDPTQSIALWQKMEQTSQNAQQPIEFMSTHPAHATRIQNLQQHMANALQLQQQANASGLRPNCTP